MSPEIVKLPILILYPHNRCNCRCVMCDIWKTSDAQEIGLADIERHADDIASLGVRWVIFSGGEPLMHSDLFALSGRLRQLGVKLTVLSTGLTIAANAERLVENVDEIIVSLDGPPRVHDRIRRVNGAFGALAAGVGAVLRLRDDFPIAARCTVQKQNYLNLSDTVETARDMRLQSISFLAADVTSTAFNRPEIWPIERQSEVSLSAHEVSLMEVAMETLIDSYAREIETGFIREGPDKLRRIARHFRAQLGHVEPISPKCNAPWVSAVVESDGAVRPCFFHEPVGNIRDQGLREAVNGAKALAFRESLDVAANPTCRRCVCSLHLPE